MKRHGMPWRSLLPALTGLACLTLLAAALAVLAVPVHAVPEEPSAQQTRRVINDIHSDVLDPVYENGTLRVRTRMGNTGSYEYADPDDVVIQLKDNTDSRLEIPDLPEFGFLGEPGSPVWVAPESQVDGLIWPGWSTENLPVDVFAFNTRTVEIAMTKVTGPGTLEVFNNGTGGEALRLFSSTDPQYRIYLEAVRTHHHVIWAFSALGTYAVTFEIAATDINGTRHVAAPVTLHWYVGGTTADDVPPELVSPSPTTSPTVSPTTGDPTTSPTTDPPTSGPTTNPPTSSPPSRPTAPPTNAPTNPPTQPPSTPPVRVPSPTTSSGGSGGDPDDKCVTPSPSPADSGGGDVPSAEKVVLDDGHVDYAARLAGGALQSTIKDGTQAGRTTWREPSSVVLHLKPDTATRVPAGFGFLGSEGTTIWQIPQTQRTGVPWLGWNTEELQSSQVSGDVTWSLDKVEGPGALAVYEYTTFGQPRVIFNSGDGVPDSTAIRLGTHAHGNWAFTKEGVYKVTFTHTATLASGTRSSDTAILTFAVGNTDPATAQATGATPLAAGSRVLVSSPGPGVCPGNLPFTGSALLGPAALGTGLLTVGGAIVGLSFVRRRRDTAASAGRE